MPFSLFTAHARPLAVLHDDLERYASSQAKVFVGTAGSLIERQNAGGFRFYARSFYDGDGQKREEYVAGPVGSFAAEAAAADVRGRISELKALVPSLRLLGREGYNLVDPRTFATLASLHNHGIFSAGGLLVGSHAYGVLLNRLGVRAAAYATEDVDIARGAALALAHPPEAGLLGMLRDSGIDFVEVPRLERGAPSTSFKQRGRSHFHVDLLVPSPGESFPVVAVPELRAHATGLPHLGYLLTESQRAMVMGREGCCSVRVPLPERFAVHKLLVSRLRVERGTKSDKDIVQASVLCAVLAETQSGAITEALSDVPRRARKRLSQAAESARRFLGSAHPRALEELGSI
ncbi:MAG TPA: GSU2403 family nucleotidyltransferase fold protein [Polyangia bacterium]|nr:GSU2403 family nucleotidyltransferase fold protein [Polyangia bacterium]